MPGPVLRRPRSHFCGEAQSAAGKRARAASTHPAFRGVSRAHLGEVTEELADPRLARQVTR